MLSPIEHIRIKEVCRGKGVNIFSIFTYDLRNTRDSSSVKDIVIESKLSYPEVLSVAIEYFKAIGYTGEVKLRATSPNCYKAILSKRLKY